MCLGDVITSLNGPTTDIDVKIRLSFPLPYYSSYEFINEVPLPFFLSSFISNVAYKYSKLGRGQAIHMMT